MKNNDDDLVNNDFNELYGLYSVNKIVESMNMLYSRNSKPRFKTIYTESNEERLFED